MRCTASAAGTATPRRTTRRSRARGRRRPRRSRCGGTASTPWRREASSSCCVPSTFVRAKSGRVLHRQRIVRLGREVDDHVELVLGQRLLGELEVGDVALHEGNALRDVLAHARVREQVVGDDVVVRPLLEPVADEVRADEAGRAGDEKPHRCGVYGVLSSARRA